MVGPNQRAKLIHLVWSFIAQLILHAEEVLCNTKLGCGRKMTKVLDKKNFKIRWHYAIFLVHNMRKLKKDKAIYKEIQHEGWSSTDIITGGSSFRHEHGLIQ